MPIRQFLKDHGAFEPEAITAMSDALERACRALHVNGDLRERQVIAARIIDLARNGVIDPGALSARVVAEAEALRAL